MTASSCKFMHGPVNEVFYCIDDSTNFIDFAVLEDYDPKFPYRGKIKRAHYIRIPGFNWFLFDKYYDLFDESLDKLEKV